MDFTNAIPSANGKPAVGISGFDAVAAAPEFAPVAPGVYLATVVKGEYVTTKRTGSDGYRLTFRIAEGEHVGRSVVRTWVFTEKAVSYAKRDLSVFGLDSSTKLLSPFPGLKEYHVRLVVALQRGDDGREFNDIKKIDVLSVTESPAAAFLVPEQSEGGPK